MDKSTTIGIFGALFVIYLAIVLQGNFLVFLSMSSFLIVLGGVLCVTVVNYSFTEVKQAFGNLYMNLRSTKIYLRTDIELVNMFARRARRDGMLALEDDIHKIEDMFLRNGFLSIMDGIKKETLINILNDQIESAERVLDRSIKLLYSMAEYAPAFGMIGTVIGLILMMQNFDDPATLGHGMAIALLTTLYGSLLANVVFLPLAGKLDNLSEKQLTRRRMCKSAIISIMEEENPRIMEDKMLIYLLPAERAEYLAYFDKQSFDKTREQLLYDNWEFYQNKPWQNLATDLMAG